MKVVKGNKILEITSRDFREQTAQFKTVVVDLGTGDGRFVYKNALQNPDTFYIGVDPAVKQMEEFSKKALRKKLNNVLFVVGSFELYPTELEHLADKLFITLPWGSLLKAVAEPQKPDVEKLANLIKSGGELVLTFGFDTTLEPTQTSRLELNPISKDSVKSGVVSAFESCGFKLTEFSEISNKEIKQLQSSWGKRISTTIERNYFGLDFIFGK